MKIEEICNFESLEVIENLIFKIKGYLRVLRCCDFSSHFHWNYINRKLKTLTPQTIQIIIDSDSESYTFH